MNKRNGRKTRRAAAAKGPEKAKHMPRGKVAARVRRQPARVPVIEEFPRLRAEQIFSGPRPASVSMGVEPAFLLFERDILARIEKRAAELGVRYESLVRQIVRDHIDRY